MALTNKSRRFFRMAMTACALAFAAVVFNAYARLTEAGLGCRDWPGCYGVLFAPLIAKDLEHSRPAAELKQLEKSRAFHETAQRMIAGTLSLVLIRLFVLGWALKKRKRTQQVLFPLAALVAVFGMSAVGFATFEYRYQPLVQMLQLLGGIAIVVLLWWIVLREQRFFVPVGDSAVGRALRPRIWIAIAIVTGQIALGGWSMVNYAGLACPDFPKCQGVWWPQMDFVAAFTMWRDLGLDYESRLLDLPGATAIHMGHRVGALIVLLYVGWLSLHVLRVGNKDNLCRYGGLVLLMLLLETTLGIAEVVAHLPLAVALAHSAGGVLLLLSLVTLYHVVRPVRTRPAD
jgi:cytochrome c oxidase assembly protein subunit 15